MAKKQSHVKSSRRTRISLDSLNLTPDECLRPFLSILSAFPQGLEPISIHGLKQVFHEEPFNPERSLGPRPSMPSEDQFVIKVKAPSFISRFFGGETRYTNRLRAAKDVYLRACSAYPIALSEWNDKADAARQTHEIRQKDLSAQVELHNSRICQFEQDLLQGEPNAVIDYFSMVLERSKYPSEIPTDFHIFYTLESNLLTVYRRLPQESVLPPFTEYYINHKGNYYLIRRPQLYKLVIAAIALRTLNELFSTDPCCILQRAIFYGVLGDLKDDIPISEDPYLVSVEATRKEYEKWLAHRSWDTLSQGVTLRTIKPVRISEIIQGYPDREIDLSPGAVVKENLPYPWVHYPNKYGVFIGFSKERGDEITICECAKQAVLNYVRLGNPVRERRAAFDLQFFPPALAERIRLSDDPFTALHFSPRVCHKCNGTQPSLRYCHEDYGGSFVTKFGWYVNQAYLSYGIVPNELGVLPAGFTVFYCPRAEALPAVFWESLELPPSFKGGETLTAESGLSAAVENIVREEFGVKKIGDAWTSETILFGMVKQIFSKRQVFRHQYPAWLAGLELDIYVPSLRLAIEYQGEQHFIPIKHWGGHKALDARKDRDRLKKSLCEKKKVRLVYVNYTDPLTEEYIRTLLREYIKGKKPSSESW